MRKFEEGMQNEDGFAFMSWEQNPLKRSVNNVVKFNLNNDITPEIGDVLQGNQQRFKILEIVSIRPSSVKGKNYIETRGEWQ